MLGGCNVEKTYQPIMTEKTKNGYEITKLFEHEGCEMFKFNDEGYARYFAKCGKAKSITTEHSVSCGKGCTRRVIETTLQNDTP
jgi:hypothetical protein